MFMKYAHHFHAYQPGDIVHVHDGDGSRPVEYEERRSPVAVKIRGGRRSKVRTGRGRCSTPTSTSRTRSRA